MVQGLPTPTDPLDACSTERTGEGEEHPRRRIRAPIGSIGACAMNGWRMQNAASNHRREDDIGRPGVEGCAKRSMRFATARRAPHQRGVHQPDGFEGEAGAHSVASGTVSESGRQWGTQPPWQCECEATCCSLRWKLLDLRVVVGGSFAARDGEASVDERQSSGANRSAVVDRISASGGIVRSVEVCMVFAVCLSGDAATVRCGIVTFTIHVPNSMVRASVLKRSVERRPGVREILPACHCSAHGV
eukprot:ctg_466.g250